MKLNQIYLMLITKTVLKYVIDQKFLGRLKFHWHLFSILNSPRGLLILFLLFNVAVIFCLNKSSIISFFQFLILSSLYVFETWTSLIEKVLRTEEVLLSFNFVSEEILRLVFRNGNSSIYNFSKGFFVQHFIGNSASARNFTFSRKCFLRLNVQIVIKVL